MEAALKALRARIQKALDKLELRAAQMRAQIAAIDSMISGK